GLLFVFCVLLLVWVGGVPPGRVFSVWFVFVSYCHFFSFFVFFFFFVFVFFLCFGASRLGPFPFRVLAPTPPRGGGVRAAPPP
ncbi:hypothetical protein ACQWG0_25705, partial [Salmonella enterica subsp. enterica serovar Infantis]